jgi:hypothetical protein
MSISFCLTKHYEQKGCFPAPPKQTQSNPNKPNPTFVFEPEIGFEYSKPASNELKCVSFLRIYTKKYILLEKFMLSFKLFFLILCAEFYSNTTLQCFQLHKDFMKKKLMTKAPKLEQDYPCL